MLGLVLAAILLARGRGERRQVAPAEKQANTAAGEQVSLEIDFGDGRRQQYDPIAWRKGMTAYDLLRETPRSDLRLEVRGTGASAFLSNLDGHANEGADGRNWTYTVNGRHADRSFAIYELRPGDRVLWSFAPQQ